MGQTFETISGGEFHAEVCIRLAHSCFSVSAFAAELPKEGSYDFTSCSSGVNNVITFSKTHTANSYEITGTNRSNPPGGLFDKITYRCVGMTASFDGKITASTVCEAIDVDGDKYLAKVSTGDGKTTSSGERNRGTHFGSRG
jgi:hypothetical protein